MRLKPNTTSIMDLTQRNQPEQSSWAQCVAAAALLLAIGALGYAAIIYMAHTCCK